MPHSIELIASTRKKTKENIRVESLVPLELREKASRLIGLLQDYYNHINELGQTSYELNSINNERDIDVSRYLDLIQKEIAVSVPKDLITDRVTLYKNLLRYYSVRGSQESVELFFKIFFNDNVELYYPKNSLLIPSSGTWDPDNTRDSYAAVIDQALSGLEFQISTGSGSGTFSLNESVVGSTSGAKSFVKSVKNGVLTVNAIQPGDLSFVKGETVKGETTITLGNYSVSQAVTGSISGATGTVSAVTDDATVDVSVTSGSFSENDTLNANGVQRKIESIQKIFTLTLGGFTVSNKVKGKISGAIGSINQITSNVLKVTYDNLNDIIGSSRLNNNTTSLASFFKTGELISEISAGNETGHIRRISSIQSKIDLTVADGSLFYVGQVVTGINDSISGTSGAVGTVESISTNNLVIKDCSGVFKNGENLVSQSNTTFLGTISATTLTVTSILSGSIKVGMTITGNGIASGTKITALLTGTGGVGTYTINQSQTVSTAAVITELYTLSTISATPVLNAYLTIANFEKYDAVKTGSIPNPESGIILDVTDNTLTLGFTVGTFSNGQKISGGDGNTISRFITSVSYLDRIRLSNFRVGNKVANGNVNTVGTAIADVVYVSGNTIKLQHITGGSFSTGNTLTGYIYNGAANPPTWTATGVVRPASTITAPPSRTISGIYRDGQSVFFMNLGPVSGSGFVAGEKVTGIQSLEFAEVIGYSSGVLTLKNSSGNFSIGEIITGSQSGSTATVLRSYTKGSYSSNQGFLDDSIKIQDSYFYQKFSYVIKTGNNVDVWKDKFNRLVHPAGFIFFGEILILLDAWKTGYNNTVMPELQPGLIYGEDIPLVIVLGTLENAIENLIVKNSSTRAKFTATIDNGSGIAGDKLTVTALASGSPVIQIGMYLYDQTVSQTGVPSEQNPILPGTYITEFVSGTNGGVGVYKVSVEQKKTSRALTGFVVDQKGCSIDLDETNSSRSMALDAESDTTTTTGISFTMDYNPVTYSDLVTSKTFVVSPGLSYIVGQSVVLYPANVNNGFYMRGTVTSYNSSTGDMTVSVTKRSGYGTHVCKVRYTDQQLKFLDGSLVETYSGMTIQQADGFSQEPTPVGSAYAWDDYTVDDVINNDTTWNGVQLRANLI